MSPELSRAEIVELKVAIDARVRELEGRRQVPRCVRCGMPTDDLTPGCSCCMDRNRRKRLGLNGFRRDEGAMSLYRYVRSRFTDQIVLDTQRANGVKSMQARKVGPYERARDVPAG